jgi:hypothetical protein
MKSAGGGVRPCVFTAYSAFRAARRNPVASPVVRVYSAHIDTRSRKENDMKILKHMEVVFVVALAFACVAGYVGAHRVTPAPVITYSTAADNMTVVHVTAKRPNAAQKLMMLVAERVRPSHA